LEGVSTVLIDGVTVKTDIPTTNISLKDEGVDVKVFWEGVGLKFTHKLSIEAGFRLEESSPTLVE
jgi:hypothetical protein